MSTTHRLGFGFWSFILFMLVLTGLFVWLGVWQVHRLAEKEALIAEVDRQLTQPPYDIPPADQWSLIELDTYAYHPVTLTGHYEDVPSVLVELGYLSNPKDEAELRDPKWRAKAVDSMCKAIALFADARAKAGG